MVGTLLVGGTYAIVKHYNRTHYGKFPKTEIMQKGYVNPSELEVKVEDRDEYKGNELYLKIKGKEYTLKYDVKGVPVLAPTK